MGVESRVARAVLMKRAVFTGNADCFLLVFVNSMLYCPDRGSLEGIMQCSGCEGELSAE